MAISNLCLLPPRRLPDLLLTATRVIHIDRRCHRLAPLLPVTLNVLVILNILT